MNPRLIGLAELANSFNAIPWEPDPVHGFDLSIRTHGFEPRALQTFCDLMAAELLPQLLADTPEDQAGVLSGMFMGAIQTGAIVARQDLAHAMAPKGEAA